jgi:hypothetical protein
MAGAFREEKNADKIFKRLSARIQSSHRGQQIPYPVLYGSYATYAEADKGKKKFRKRTIQKPGF